MAQAEYAKRQGLFGPGSVTWRINREAVLLLGGPRALLLQLAHPLVAAGVAEHSDFRRAPLVRLRRTLELTLGIVFGDERSARACAARVRSVHERVHGVLPTATPHRAAGTPYSALDPALLLWVHAALVDTSLLVYQRLVAPLALSERQRFYQESKQSAALFGVPAAAIPPDLRAFQRYVREMIAGHELEVSPEARELADLVLHPPIAGVPRWLGDLGGVITLGLLPAALRRRYGLPWAGRHRHGFRLAVGLVRRTLPLLPAPLRLFPAARQAERRLRVRPSQPDDGRPPWPCASSFRSATRTWRW